MTLQVENHFKIVSRALATQDEPSRDVCDSAAALAIKLDALKRQGGLFEGISFSPDAQELLHCTQVLS